MPCAEPIPVVGWLVGWLVGMVARVDSYGETPSACGNHRRTWRDLDARFSLNPRLKAPSASVLNLSGSPIHVL